MKHRALLVYLLLASSVLAADVTPRTANSDSLGSSTYPWTNGYFVTIYVTNLVVGGTVAGSIIDTGVNVISNQNNQFYGSNYVQVSGGTMTIGGTANASSKNGLQANSKAVVVSTNAVGGMMCSFTTTTNALTVNLPNAAKFMGNTTPVGVASWYNVSSATLNATTNAGLAVTCTSNQVVIAVGIPLTADNAFTNINVIVHGVAPN
jgi:hypothetical protein